MAVVMRRGLEMGVKAIVSLCIPPEITSNRAHSKCYTKNITPPKVGMLETLFTGFYPPIHDRRLPPHDWLSNYYQTYLERDVRSILNVGDIETFGRFMRLCAGRTGQLLNLSGLASDCGITHTTARRWISVLEASFIVTLLRPHYKNFGKRIIKSPKLYFLDTGLLCYLLGVRTPESVNDFETSTILI